MGLRGPRSTARWRREHLAKSYAEPISDPTAASRVRRHRQRQKSGRILVQVELPELETLELLIASECLDGRADYFSRQDIAAGIERFLSLARNA